MNEPTLPMRWILIALLVAAALSFFFPLVSIHIPLAGDQQWSGYDVIVRGRDMDRSLDSLRGSPDLSLAAPSESEPGTTSPAAPSSTPGDTIDPAPFSVRTLGLLPIEIGFGFFAAALAIFLSFRRSSARALTFVRGWCCSRCRRAAPDPGKQRSACVDAAADELGQCGYGEQSLRRVGQNDQ